MQGFEIREYSGSLNRVYLIWQWMKQYIFAFQYTTITTYLIIKKCDDNVILMLLISKSEIMEINKLLII